MENSTVTEKTHRAKKMMVWLIIAGIAMFFAAFTSAYIVLQADNFWVKDSLPFMFYISTGIILISSLTVYLAQRSIKKGNVGGLKFWTLLTFILGLAFTVSQYQAWSELRSGGKFFVGSLSSLKGEYGTDYLIMMKGEPLLFSDGNFYKPSDIAYTEPLNQRVNDTFNISASFLYILSGLHIAHLLGGLIWLCVVLYGSFAGEFSLKSHLSVDLGTVYWHFLDILWVYLFLFLLFIR